MRVLIVNQYYPPDRSATAVMARAAATAFRRAGHQVTVVCGRPSYDITTHKAWRLVSRSNEDGIEVVRVGSTAATRQRMSGRVANYTTFAALASGVVARSSFDVALAMTDPPFIAAAVEAVNKIKRVPTVIWSQDVHPELARATGMIADGPLYRAWSASQRIALERADAVVALGDDMRERLIAMGAAPNRTHVVVNGVDAAHANADTDDVELEPLIKEVRRDYPFVAIHGGNLGSGGAFGTLIDAVRELRNDGCALAFVGDGAARTRLEAQARGLDNVVFVDRVTPAAYAAVAGACDVQVVTVKRGVEGLMVPTKLYEALAIGRPLLAVADDQSDVVRVTRRHQCGFVADPDQPHAIAAALRQAANTDDTVLATMGESAAQAAPQYDRDVSMAKIVAICESAVVQR